MSAPTEAEMRRLTNLAAVAFVPSPEPGLVVAALQGLFYLPLDDGDAPPKIRYLTLGWREPTAVAATDDGLVVGLESGLVVRARHRVGGRDESRPYGGGVATRGELELEPLGLERGAVRSLLLRREKDQPALYAATAEGLFRRRGEGAWEPQVEGIAREDLARGVLWLLQDPLLAGRLFAQTAGRADSVLYEIGLDAPARLASRPVHHYHSLHVYVDHADVMAHTPATQEFHLVALLLAANLDPRSQRLQALAIAAAGPATIYAGIDCCGVYRVTREGYGWEAARRGPRETPIVALAVHPEDAGRVFAVSSRSVQESRDGGGTWRDLYRSEAPPAATLGGAPGVTFAPGTR